MLEQNQNRIISNKAAAIIGLVLLTIPIVYWILVLLELFSLSEFAYQTLHSLPRNFWVVNFVIYVIVWKINRMSIWIDRFGDWEGLFINKILIETSFAFFIIQVIYLLINGMFNLQLS